MYGKTNQTSAIEILISHAKIKYSKTLSAQVLYGFLCFEGTQQGISELGHILFSIKSDNLITMNLPQCSKKSESLRGSCGLQHAYLWINLVFYYNCNYY